MRKLLILTLCILGLSSVAYSEENTLVAANIPAQQAIQPIKTSVSQCYDTVSVNAEQLFYLTLATLNKMNFKIKEVQSKTGTVLFQAYSREFLVTIADKGVNSSFIKILPADSNYSFSPSIVQNIFGFIKANSSVTPIVL